MPKFGGTPRCPRCVKAVYYAEQRIVLGKPWHKTCVTCNDCKRTLDAGFNDNHGEVYCRRCYGKRFGPKGYGYGGGAGVLSSEKCETKRKFLKKTAPKPASKPCKPSKTAPKPPPSGDLCSSCEKPLRANAKFCTECGAKAVPKPKGLSCPKCTAVAKPGQTFCTECGTKIASGCPACSAKTSEGQKFCTSCGHKL
ncbi:hypothetical protein AAMO2058_000994200 [Amorphochlora amoebiformis]